MMRVSLYYVDPVGGLTGLEQRIRMVKEELNNPDGFCNSERRNWTGFVDGPNYVGERTLEGIKVKVPVG